MHGEPDPLLATKLHVPRVRADMLPRPRLIERVEEASNHELLLVSAPAGFGKSTLLAAWARTTRRPLAWLSLDADDNDSSRFWRYVAAAVGRVRPDLEERTDPLLRAPDVAPGGVVTVLVNELVADRPAITLVLDDYHAIESVAIHQGLALLLEHLPPGLRLVVASRSDPPLALASMRARGTLTELRERDLRFASEEAVELLRASGVTLSPERAAALAERTEGWAAGLQLAALSMRGAPDPDRLVEGFTGGHRYVLDYLTEEVLERQPDGVRSFLLETSVLERLTAALCDAVTGRSDGQSMLEGLERANLFLVALDDERGWYRYHRLFADLLRARLREGDPELARELHRRAAVWCAEHAMVDHALRHALEAGIGQLAVDAVERHVDDVLGRGEGATLRRWLGALPAELVRARPGLSLVHAITTFNAGQLWSAEALLDDAERGLAGPRPNPEPGGRSRWPDSPLTSIPATIASVRAGLAFARGQPERTRRFAQRSSSLQAREDGGPGLPARWNLALADWMQGRTVEAERAFVGIVAEGRARGVAHLVLSARSFLARIQRAEGRLGAALQTYREDIQAEATRGRSPVPSVGMAHVGAAEVLYERDELEAARSHVEAGIELCRWLISAQPLAVGLATLAWIRQATGDAAGAREAMEEAYRTIPTPDVVSLYHPVPAERARLLLVQGAVPEVAAWIEERGLLDSDEPTYARELEYLVLARLLIVRGAPDRAAGLLARLGPAAVAEGRLGSVVRIRAVEALAAAAAGDRARAQACLADALALARPEGYVRVFADEGSAMGGLLASARRTGAPDAGVPREYLSRLLRAFRHAPAGDDRTAALVEPLTGRELEILGMLATGRSNRRIADELVITLETVKKHVTHIFWKLGADNRTQAVALARELRLID